MTAVVLRGDARSLPLPDASVDLIVTSPPYYALRDYRDAGASMAGQIGSEDTPAEYLAALWECTAEWMRVLKPEGSIFVVLGDKYNSAASNQQGDVSAVSGLNRGKENRYTGRGRALRNMPEKCLLGLPWRYAIGCTDRLGLILRAEIIWHKPNSLPESVTDRVRRSHEQVFHLVKQPRYYSAIDQIREPHTGNGHGGGTYGGAGNRSGNGVTHRSFLPRPGEFNPLGKLPGSVWNIPSAPLVVPARLGVAHFAAFPPALVRPIILGWSPPGYVCACPGPSAPTRPALVLDPFAGTGTTMLTASVLGRIGVGVDRSADYCRLAKWRVSDPGERARALDVPKPPPVMDGQGELFAALEATP